MFFFCSLDSKIPSGSRPRLWSIYHDNVSVKTVPFIRYTGMDFQLDTGLGIVEANC